MERPLKPAKEAPRDRIFELLHDVRASLRAAGEGLNPEWVDQTVDELATGQLVGWCDLSDESPGIGFYSGIPGRAYGHLHVSPGSLAAPHLLRLLDQLVASLPGTTETMDVGVTGFPPTERPRVWNELKRRGDGRPFLRLPMTRPGSSLDGAFPAIPPTGTRIGRVRTVGVEALAHLDVAAYRGSEDDLLSGGSPTEYRRSLQEILDAKLGRLLDDASAVLVGDQDRPVAAILTTEINPHEALFVDLVVVPELRRRGWGTFLLRYGLRALYALGYSSSRLWVTESNRSARRIYDRLGFAAGESVVSYRWSRQPVPRRPESTGIQADADTPAPSS